jgi:hypothetical protein
MTRCFYIIAIVLILPSAAVRAGDNRLTVPSAGNYDLYKSSPKLPAYEPSQKYQAPVFDAAKSQREVDKFTRDVLDKHNEPANKKFLEDLKRYETTSPSPDYSYSEPDPEPAETSKPKPQRSQPVQSDWRVEKNRAGKPCIALSYPQIALTAEIVSSSQRHLNFGAMSVSMSPTDLSQNSVKLDLGYTHHADYKPVATIQSETFPFVAKKDRAFPRDSDTESRLLKAMKAGEAMTVKGVASDGTPREERYSLIGFTSAFYTLALRCR